MCVRGSDHSLPNVQNEVLPLFRHQCLKQCHTGIWFEIKYYYSSV